MLLDAGRAFAAIPAAPSWAAPALVLPPDRPRPDAAEADAVADPGGAFRMVAPIEFDDGFGWEPPGPGFEPWEPTGLPEPMTEGFATVDWPPGPWEVGAVEVFDDLPFTLPPLQFEPEGPHGTWESASPIDLDGGGAIGGAIGPAEQVDFYKLEGGDALYRLAFGNREADAKGGHLIWLLDGRGRMLTSLVMPAGKSVITVDMRFLQTPGEPLYIGIARDATQGMAEVAPYWVFVEPVGRSAEGTTAGGAGAAGGDPLAFGAERGQGGASRTSGASRSGVAMAVAASEAAITGGTTGLATGPLPRLATGMGRGLFAPAFQLGLVDPDEGPAIDLPAQAIGAGADGRAGTGSGDGETADPGPVVALPGSRLPLLAAAHLGVPEVPTRLIVPDGGVRSEGGAEAAPAELAADRAEPRRFRRLPAGLGLATVLAVSLVLPDFAATRPGMFLRRRLGLAAGGGRRPPA
jgi:hypothetical protein